MFIFIRREQCKQILRVESILRVYPRLNSTTVDGNGEENIIPACVVFEFVDQEPLLIVEDGFRRDVVLIDFMEQVMHALNEVVQSKGSVCYVVQDMKREDPAAKVPLGQVRRPKA